ncbi:hypothetical protein EBZ39_04350 [bacterium]|nr:hypothetical protein [bacterium]
MRYFIKPADPALTWLLNIDAAPSTLPFFPNDSGVGLVVAQLLSGKILAEVLPTEEHVRLVCGGGVPLGRLYFHVPKARLYPVCPKLSSESFGGNV